MPQLSGERRTEALQTGSDKSGIRSYLSPDLNRLLNLQFCMLMDYPIPLIEKAKCFIALHHLLSIVFLNLLMYKTNGYLTHKNQSETFLRAIGEIFDS